MRKFFLLALLVTAAPAADAAPIVAGGSIHAMAGATAQLQTVACARHGWRGWGVYPGCFGPTYVAATPYYAAPPVYVTPEVYLHPPRRCWIAGAWRQC